MKKNSELPKLRISTELAEKMNKALEFVNKNDIELQIDMPQFRRMAYKHFSEKILSEGFGLEITPE